MSAWSEQYRHDQQGDGRNQKAQTRALTERGLTLTMMKSRKKKKETNRGHGKTWDRRASSGPQALTAARRLVMGRGLSLRDFGSVVEISYQLRAASIWLPCPLPSRMSQARSWHTAKSARLVGLPRSTT